METIPLEGSDLRLSLLGQGTWQISSQGSAAERALDALERGIALGMTHLDRYGSGASERLLARLWQERGVAREQLVLASKVLPSHASRKGTIEACERSLRRLGCAEKLAHVEENFRGTRFELSPQETAAIDRGFPVRGGDSLAML